MKDRNYGGDWVSVCAGRTERGEEGFAAKAITLEAIQNTWESGKINYPFTKLTVCRVVGLLVSSTAIYRALC